MRGDKDDFLKDMLIVGSGVALKIGSFKTADVVPDNWFVIVVAPVDSSEYFTPISTNDYLWEAVVGASFNNASAHYFFLYLHDVLQLKAIVKSDMTWQNQID